MVDISGMVSEFIRRSHYNESVSVLSHYIGGTGAGEGGAGDRVDTREAGPGGRQEEEEAAEPENPAMGRVRKGFRLQSICWD